mgnify:CR=1 FL=1|tara:strand:- start:198 stop:497 length:300 start_codon:yes stop_codon:yes gene_type:complete
MVFLIFLLTFFLILSLYFCIKFALIIIKIQDSLEESLDIIDNKYNNLSKILEIPVFYNSPEVKSAINEIEDARDSLLYIANQLTDNLKKSIKEEEEDFD